jgi:hypothetical protein
LGKISNKYYCYQFGIVLISSRTINNIIRLVPNPMNTLPFTDHSKKRVQRITVYPNLVSQRKFWLQLYNIDKCVFTVQLYSLAGQQVFKHFLYHAELHSNHTVQLPRQLARGIYKVAIRCGDNHYVQPIVID